MSRREEYNIVHYGATAETVSTDALQPSNEISEKERERITANGRAIQAAVDAAHAAGGGTVVVPAGRFVTASFVLKSNVRLHVSEGGELMGSPNWQDYPRRSESGESVWNTVALIYAENAENIGIEGEGRIDGQGHGRIYFPSEQDPMHRRPFLVLLWKCKNIVLQDITLYNPGLFTFLAEKSEYIRAERVKIHSMETENGDGLDFDGSSHVVIKDCIFETGDDGISPKTHYPGWPCEDYDISGCYFKSVWAGFRPGTETAEDMRDIRLHDCVFDDCNDAIKIQECGPGCISDVVIENVLMRGVHRPIFMTVNPFRLSKYETSIRPVPGGIKRICIENVTAIQPPCGVEYQRNCMVISGSVEVPIEDVTLRNFHALLQGDVPEGAYGRAGVPEYLDYTTIYADIFSIAGGFPASGLYMRHVNGLLLENCDWTVLNGDSRPVLFGSDVQRLRVVRNSAVTAEASGALLQAVESEVGLENCTCNGQAVAEALSLSSQELSQYQAMKACSERTLAQMKALAAGVDKALSMPCRAAAAYTDWVKEGNVWRTTLTLEQAQSTLLLQSFGDVELWLNDVMVGSCVLEEPYRDTILWACDLQKSAVAGANRLELRWRDEDARGGMVCKLPFGAFEEKTVGVFGMEIAYEKLVTYIL